MLKMSWANMALAVIQMVVYAWSVLTLPIYFLIYRPWLKTRSFHRKRAQQIDTQRNEVTFRGLAKNSSTRDEIFNAPENINNMAKLWNFMLKKYSARRCLGTRSIIEEKRIPSSTSGKIFTKYVQMPSYRWLTYSEVDEKSTWFGRGLAQLGVRPRDKVVMYCDTKAEWLVSALGCFKFNFGLVTIYTNLGEDAVAYGINQTGAAHVITSQELLPKLIKIIDKLPAVHCIIVIEEPWKGEVDLLDVEYEDKKSLYTWKSVYANGKTAKAGVAQTSPTGDDTAILMYTSGSTGNPKGVILTHNNLVSAVCSIVALAENAIDDVSESAAYIGYLPLAHVLELLAEHVVLLLGIGIGYSSPNTLTDSSTMVMPGAMGDASVLRPTVMAAVPVILDRIYKGINAKVRAGGHFKTKLMDFAVRYRADWVRRGYDTPIMNKLVFSKLTSIVGGRVSIILSGGAPLSEEAHSFIRTALCCHLAQGYGLTESCSTATITDADDISVGRVGTPLQGVDLKIVDWEEGGYTVRDKCGPRGEIVVGGAHIAAGYYNMPEQTAAEFYEQDGKRWFRTGDIGQVMADGSLKIIDRKKDLVKLQMGEYVSLGKVESNLKIHPLVDNVCVCARPTENFVVGLIVPDEAKLADLAESFLTSTPGTRSLPDLCNDPGIVEEFRQVLADHGQRMGLAKFETPKRIALVPDQWTPDSGLVTAAMKLKRKQIEAKFGPKIDELYDDSNRVDANANVRKKVNMNRVDPA